MKTSLLLLPALFLAPAIRTGIDNGQGLTHLPPRDPLAESQDDVAFQPEPWRVLLADEDLDRREESFDRLVRRARRDPAARAFLKALAAEPGELSWTARLALRELRGAGNGFALPEEFGGLDPFAVDLNEMLQGLSPRFRFLMPPHGGAQALQPLGGSQNTRSLSVQKGPDGWRIEVTEDQGGQSTTRTYEGTTLEEILQEHPELEGELGLQADGSAEGFRFQLSGPEALRELFAPPDSAFGWMPGDRGLGRKLGKSLPLRTDKLGVRVAPITLQQAERLGLDAGTGLLVDSVVPATIAGLLGVEPGSVLLRLEGRELKSASDISEVLEARPPTGSLTLEWVAADGSRHTQTWQPAPAPAPAPVEPPAPAPSEL